LTDYAAFPKYKGHFIGCVLPETLSDLEGNTVQLTKLLIQEAVFIGEQPDGGIIRSDVKNIDPTLVDKHHNVLSLNYSPGTRLEVSGVLTISIPNNPANGVGLAHKGGTGLRYVPETKPRAISLIDP
jgi:hypothetical protein